MAEIGQDLVYMEDGIQKYRGSDGKIYTVPSSGGIDPNGLVLPVFTTAEMNAIASPVEGALILNSDYQVGNTLFQYNAGSWAPINANTITTLFTSQPILTDLDPLTPTINLDNEVPIAKFTTGSSATVSGTAIETSLLGTIVSRYSNAQTFPANGTYKLNSVGRMLHIKASGYFNDTATPTIELKFKLGSTAILDTGAVLLPTLGGNKLWTFEGDMTVQTAGASGKVIAQGRFIYNGISLDLIQAAQINIDLTPALLADLTALWGTSSNSNIIVCTNFRVEEWN